MTTNKASVNAHYAVIVYARVSTEDQAEKGYSLPDQVEKCVLKAREWGYNEDQIVVITDEVSGALLDRPGLNRLREAVQSELIPDIVLIFDPDRLARKLSYQLLLTDEIIKRGVRLEFVNFTWSNTAEGRMFYQLRGMFAEFEREKIRERTMRGRLSKMKHHRKLSCDPRLYGYTFDTEHDELIVNPVEHGIIKWMFVLAAEGYSGERIAKLLAERQIPAPRGTRWYGSTVTRILHNRSYLGIYLAYKTDYHAGYRRKRPREEQFELLIEPLIDEELFTRVQMSIADHRKHTGRPAERSYMLSGLAYCGCGQPMYMSGGTNSQASSYYVCSCKRNARREKVQDDSRLSPCAYWNVEAVEVRVWQALLEQMPDYQAAYSTFLESEQLCESFVGSNLTSSESLELQVSIERCRQLEQQLDKITELYITGAIDHSNYSRKKERIDALLFAKRNQMLGMEQLLEQKQLSERFHPSDTLPYKKDPNSDIMSYNRLFNHWFSIPVPDKKWIARTFLDRVQFDHGRVLTLFMKNGLLSAKSSDSEGNGGS